MPDPVRRLVGALVGGLLGFALTYALMKTMGVTLLAATGGGVAIGAGSRSLPRSLPWAVGITVLATPPSAGQLRRIRSTSGSALSPAGAAGAPEQSNVRSAVPPGPVTITVSLGAPSAANFNTCRPAARPATAADGREVGAWRGLLRTLLALLREPDTTHVAIAFDQVIESFRNQLFSGYKTGEGIDPALWAQIWIPKGSQFAEKSG